MSNKRLLSLKKKKFVECKKSFIIYNIKLKKFLIINNLNFVFFKKILKILNNFILFKFTLKKKYLKKQLKLKIKYFNKINLLYLKILQNIYFNLKHSVQNLYYKKIFVIFFFYKLQNDLNFLNINFNIKLNFFETTLMKIFFFKNFKYKLLKKKFLNIIFFYKNYLKNIIQFYKINILLKKKKKILLQYLYRAKFLRYLFINYFELNLKNWLNIFDYKKKYLYLIYQFYKKVKTLKKLKDLKKLKIYKKLLLKKLKYLKKLFFKYEYYKYFNSHKKFKQISYIYTNKLLSKFKQYSIIKNKFNKISLPFILYIKNFNKIKNSIGFCVLNKSRFNFFLTITDYSGNVLVARNLGFLHFKSIDLFNKSNYYRLGNSCNFIILEKKIYILNLKIKLPKLRSIQIKSSVFGLIHSGFELKNIEYIKLKAHNGIKKKKSKRL